MTNGVVCSLARRAGGLITALVVSSCLASQASAEERSSTTASPIVEFSPGVRVPLGDDQAGLDFTTDASLGAVVAGRDYLRGDEFTWFITPRFGWRGEFGSEAGPDDVVHNNHMLHLTFGAGLGQRWFFATAEISVLGGSRYSEGEPRPTRTGVVGMRSVLCLNGAFRAIHVELGYELTSYEEALHHAFVFLGGFDLGALISPLVHASADLPWNR